MDNKEKTDKVKSKIRFPGKKTLIAAMAVVVIATAAVLNIILIGDPADASVTETLSDKLSTVASKLESAEDGIISVADYFSNVAVNRKSARDEAMQVLSNVAEDENALEDVRTSALGDMQQIALDIEREAEIETLMKAKGFEECLAVVNGRNASVIVKTGGLTPGEVAQISEIVYTECGVLPDELKIVEKN